MIISIMNITIMFHYYYVLLLLVAVVVVVVSSLLVSLLVAVVLLSLLSYVCDVFPAWVSHEGIPSSNKDLFAGTPTNYFTITITMTITIYL